MQQSKIGCTFAAHLKIKKTMADNQKNKLNDLQIFFLVMVFMGGCAAFYFQEGKHQAEQNAKFRQYDKERREKIEQGLIEAQRHRDSVSNTVKNRKSIGNFVIVSNDDDRDYYDDPDFDDLIPGEEYDEEFVDRSEGDPELYEESS